MTAPGVPSPQEELRAAIADIVHDTAGPEHANAVADAIVPLFAARVAAIEAECATAQRFEALAQSRAEKAEGRVAAERTQAAAQALEQAATEIADSQSSPAVISGDNIENPAPLPWPVADVADFLARDRAQRVRDHLSAGSGSTDGAGTAGTDSIHKSIAGDGAGTPADHIAIFDREAQHVCPYGCECPEHNPARAGGPDA